MEEELDKLKCKVATLEFVIVLALVISMIFGSLSIMVAHDVGRIEERRLQAIEELNEAQSDELTYLLNIEFDNYNHFFRYLKENDTDFEKRIKSWYKPQADEMRWLNVEGRKFVRVPETSELESE